MAKRILLADDSITIQKVISITFASEDYDLEVVGDGDTAMQKARELKPDLIMADVAMPGKTGYEVCSAVKNDPGLKDTPVLLLAGTFEPLNRDEAMKAGADDSIVKPFESQELLDKVRDLLSRTAGRPETASAPKAASPELQTNDMWEAGDFLSLPDEFDEKKEDKGLDADLDFLTSGALFEADEPQQDELSLPQDGDEFTDLVLHEEELKPAAGGQKKDEPVAPSFDGGFEGFRDEPQRAPFDLSAFELKDEAPPARPFEAEPFDIEPFEPEKKPEPAAPWEAPSAEAEAGGAEAKEDEFVEPDLLEMPEDVVEPAPAPFARAEERKTIPFERPYDSPRPIREVITPAASAPRPTDEDVAKALQAAADRVEARLTEEMNRKAAAAEARVAESIERAVARVEEKLRADLGSKLSTVDTQVARAIDNTVTRLEERLRSELGARLEKSLAVPKEEVEAIVSKASKQVVEHVAWEVLPELAERLIKTEINRVKDALIRSRS